MDIASLEYHISEIDKSLEENQKAFEERMNTIPWNVEESMIRRDIAVFTSPLAGHLMFLRDALNRELGAKKAKKAKKFWQIWK